MVLAITPEGTRKGVAKWRRGFLYIAAEANVPLLLGAIDYKKKHIEVTTEFKPTGDVDADLRAIKKFYSVYNAKYPEKFITDDE
jgi:1-acyl-sn-glycerol-3-phosphate acyltransferase